MEDFKQSVDLIYSVDGLKAALSIAAELFSESGMSPSDIIRVDSRSYRFDYYDALAVKADVMPLSEYERRHYASSEDDEDEADFARGFARWAEAYFHPLCVEHLDNYIPVREALADFRLSSGNKEIAIFPFMERLWEFSQESDYIAEMNPNEMCAVKPSHGRCFGRILRRPTDKDGHHYGGVLDYLYMKTNSEVYPILKANLEKMDKAIDTESSLSSVS